MEYDVAKEKQASYADLDAFCRRVLSTIGASSAARTFGEVADEYMEYKYGANAPKTLTEGTHKSDLYTRRNVSALDQFPLDDLPLQRMQEAVNALQTKSIVKMKAVTFIKQVYKYAMQRGYIQRDESALLHPPERGDIAHGQPFSDSDLSVLWANSDNPDAAAVLIMCYSGFRVSAYRSMEVNRDLMYFKGGVKTTAGKGRIVPIHSAIQPLLDVGWKIFSLTDRSINRRVIDLCASLGISRHTPHDCRHTFSRLCEKYGVPEADRKRMLGHSFGSDITNAVYGHRTIEELRASIEKITCPIVTSCDK
jgi:integrase